MCPDDFKKNKIKNWGGWQNSESQTMMSMQMESDLPIVENGDFSLMALWTRSYITPPVPRGHGHTSFPLF